MPNERQIDGRVRQLLVQTERYVSVDASDVQPALLREPPQFGRAGAQLAIDLIDGRARELTGDDRAEGHPAGLGNVEEDDRPLRPRAARVSTNLFGSSRRRLELERRAGSHGASGLYQ